MPRMLLHIGAHKTATSYMQKKLALNIDLLDRRGLVYVPREAFRQHFTPLLRQGVEHENEWARDLRQAAAGKNVVISEENISGVPGDLVRDGTYYARIGERLARTCMLLGVESPEIYFALRDYAAFSVSMYSEYIRHREYIAFPEYRKIYEASGFSWVGVIEDMLAAVPGARFTLWDFGKYREIEDQVFGTMLAVDPGDLKSPEGAVRESFSAMAIRAFDALGGVLAHADFKKIMAPVARNLSRSEGYPAFDPYPREAKEQMRAGYEADKGAIAARFPEISFIGGV